VEPDPGEGLRRLLAGTTRTERTPSAIESQDETRARQDA
jgi:hypothetical protein